MYKESSGKDNERKLNNSGSVPINFFSNTVKISEIQACKGMRMKPPNVQMHHIFILMHVAIVQAGLQRKT